MIEGPIFLWEGVKMIKSTALVAAVENEHKDKPLDDIIDEIVENFGTIMTSQNSVLYQDLDDLVIHSRAEKGLLKNSIKYLINNHLEDLKETEYWEFVEEEFLSDEDLPEDERVDVSELPDLDFLGGDDE